MKNIIFDLDLTLVDSTVAEQARHERRWQDVYSMIPRFAVYDGLEDVFEFIRKNGVKVAIVSTAPKTYVERVVDFHNIPCDVIVGYHDAKPIKPHPAGMLRAMELLGVGAQDTLSFGDRQIDIQASNAAGIRSVACLWGSKETNRLLNMSCYKVLTNPADIIKLL